MSSPLDHKPVDRNAPTVSGAGEATSFPPLMRSASDGAVPQTIGAYRILQLIGQGGMGAVYLAEQENPRRTVALKVIKAGYVSRGLLRRFELEAQVLGRLQHPGIAQIFEAGTFDAGQGAQPYFAMEYIKGRPLTEFVLERHAAVNERLDLLAKICDAVHHAHQKGVVHRDLKPANILVVQNESGVLQPKILDFGVARATDADIQVTTMQTDIGQLVGTLPYMSPEQIAGDPNELDTRSDVYALGVIAFELLGGRLPHDIARKTVAQAARIIAEEEPTRLSTVNRGMRGDVETIVSKALEKEKSRRYQSAADLASDIRRYLRDEPIVARPPSAMYTLSKFAKRNKTLVGGIAAVFVVLLLGLAGTLWKWAEATHQRDSAVAAHRQANEARATAELESQKTRMINNFLVKELLGAANPNVAKGEVITVEMVLAEAVKKVATAFPGQPALEGSVRGTIGETYQAMGKFPEAMEQFLATLDLMIAAHGRDHDDVFTTTVNLAVTENRMGKLDESVKRLSDALPDIERALGPDHRITLVGKQVLASSLSDQGKYDQAEPLLKAVMESQFRVYGEEHEDAQVSISNYAYLLGGIGRNAEAEPLYRKIYDLRMRTLGEVHPRTLAAMGNLAVTLHEMGKSEETESLFRRSYESSVRVLGEDHPSTLDAMANLASYISISGRNEEAFDLMHKANLSRHRILGDDHPDTISSDLDLLNSLRQLKRYDQAIEVGTKVLATSRAKLGDDHPLTMSVLNGVATTYFAASDLPHAEELMQQVLAARTRVLGEDHPDTNIARHNLGAIFVAMKKFEAGETLLRRALEGNRRTIGEEHREVGKNLAELGRLYEATQRPKDALAMYQESLSVRKVALGPTHPELLATWRDVLRLHTELAEFEAAEHIGLEYLKHCQDVEEQPGDVTTGCLRGLIALYEAWQKPDQVHAYQQQLPVSSTP